MRNFCRDNCPRNRPTSVVGRRDRRNRNRRRRRRAPAGQRRHRPTTDRPVPGSNAGPARTPGCRGVLRGPDAARHALTGVDTVFMVSGAEDPQRLADHLTFVDAAAAAGVRRIVYTSFFGAGPDSTFLLARDHWYTEQRIRDLGLEFTFLRDNLYADQFLDFAGPEGVLRGPAGDGRVAAVARADVIDVAVDVLQAAAFSPASTEHDGMTYGLTGPAALNLDEVAEIITTVTGRRGPLRTGDRRAGLRVAGRFRRTRVAGRRVGQHLHRDSGRRAGRGDRRRRVDHRSPADQPGAVARRLISGSRALGRITAAARGTPARPSPGGAPGAPPAARAWRRSS